MSKTMGKILAAILTLSLLTGCSPSPTLMTVNGVRLDASEYAYYFNYQLTVLDDVEDVSEEDVKGYKEAALEQMVLNEIILQKSKQYDIKLSKEEKEKIEQLKKDFIRELGGAASYLDFLNKAAMTDRMYDRSQTSMYYHEKLVAHLTENLDLEESVGFNGQTLRQHYSDNYIKIKYIFMATFDENGDHKRGETIEEANNFVRQVAEGSKDPEKDFDLLVEKYNDDEQAMLHPEGFTYSLGELKEVDVLSKALDLKENEVGGPYPTDSGNYIIKRLPVDAGYFDANSEIILDMAISERLDALFDKWMKDAKIKMSQDLYSKINNKNYMEFVK